MPEDRVTEGAVPPDDRGLPEHARAKGPRLSLELGDARRRRFRGSNSVGGFESQTPGKDARRHDRGGLQDLVERRLLVIRSSWLACALERNLLRPAAGLAPAHAANVVRDLD